LFFSAGVYVTEIMPPGEGRILAVSCYFGGKCQKQEEKTGKNVKQPNRKKKRFERKTRVNKEKQKSKGTNKKGQKEA
jgi:hypothetical protein